MPTETKKIRKVLKEYFTFSTGERKGIIYLLIILILLISLPSFYDLIFPQKLLAVNIEELRSLDDISVTSTSYNHLLNRAGLFRFDPNTATDKELEDLGFTDKNIRTIRNYLLKGGSFKNADDLKKIYGIQSDLFENLRPYITFSAMRNPSFFPKDSISHKKYKLNKVIEINSADSAELVSLYRIGPSTAARIIDYRNKLGGFLTVEQLTEIWGFDEDILYDLKGKITADPGKAIIHDLNAVTIDELKAHPYFKYKLSNAIVNFRKQHGNFSKLEDLKKIAIVNDSVYNKITLYLKLN